MSERPRVVYLQFLTNDKPDPVNVIFSLLVVGFVVVAVVGSFWVKVIEPLLR